ncbi:hypothetical protein GCM10027442_39710 [Emticicia fontis]
MPIVSFIEQIVNLVTENSALYPFNKKTFDYFGIEDLTLQKALDGMIFEY